MLAETYELPVTTKKIRGKWVFSEWPRGHVCPYVGWYMSEKIDGVRAIFEDGKLNSRSGALKFAVPKEFTKNWPRDIVLDGELYGGPGTFSETSGLVRRHDATIQDWSALTYCVFDMIDADHTFEERYEILKQILPNTPYIRLVEQTKVHTSAQFYSEFQRVIKAGGEGLMLKNPKSLYEQKRSHNLLKVKPVLDMEAKVIGFVEGKGKYKGFLGSFLVRMIDNDTKKLLSKTFRLAGRLSVELRQKYVFKPDGRVILPQDGPVMGSIVTYQYMDLTDNGIPRQPIFIRMVRQ